MALSVSEELARLLELRDRGVLTPAEFDAQKARVLAGGASDTIEIPADKKSSHRVRNGSLGCLGLIVLLIIIGIIAGNGAHQAGNAATATAEATPEQTKAIGITARQLAQAYDDNEAAAQRDYGDHQLFVMGTVTGVDLDIVDNPVVQLGGINPFLPVQVNLTDDDKSKASDLHKGQKIDVLCQGVSEIVSAPILKDCTFAK